MITGGQTLNGELTVSGSKNAVLPIICATVLAGGPCTIENIPKIIEIGKKEYKKLNSELYINNEFNKTEKFSLLHEKNN